MSAIDVSSLGEFIREQRQAAQLSLRQLAATAGVSNPYLSQVERGLRKPSAEILAQIAAALRISAETLYVRAGLLEAQDSSRVRAAIARDSALTERQRRALLEIYRAFVAENVASGLLATTEDGPVADGAPTDGLADSEAVGG
ncbi:MAG: helix-turn-helix domain-containing protein [Candidatus Nanopelagicales bacterium]